MARVSTATMIIFRPVYGERINDLCHDLAEWGQDYGDIEVYHPSSRDDETLRSQLFSPKEIRPALGKAAILDFITNPDTHSSIEAHLGRNATSVRQASVVEVRLNNDARGTHFLSLLYAITDGQELRKERMQICRGVTSRLAEEAQGVIPDFKPYIPNIKLAVIPNQVGRTELDSLVSRVQGRLPIGVILDEIVFPGRRQPRI